ncbi:MAG: GNAT family N-acetyltransferase [Hyphomicrobiaceae bacterium]
MAFRPAGPKDAAVLARLMRAYYAYDGHDYDEVTVGQTLDAFLAEPAYGRAWLIEIDGTPAGYMVMCIGFSLEFGGRDAFVDEIYLEQAYRGRGIGRKALDHMIAEARRLGIRALHLEVDRDNALAERLYRALGFAPRDRFVLMSRVV